MSLKETIDSDIKKAMLAKEKDTLRALRAIKSAILLAQTEKGGEEQLSEEKEIALLMKAAKQRKESAEIYTQQGREDLAQTELDEVAVIEKYLPQQMSEDEIESAIKPIIEKTGASAPSDMGKVMGIAMKELAGKADGKTISAMVKKLLN